ncbi:MAG: hypothetical protein JO222_02145 [Frankiales bacterium]|nr:hypothetical protein [Frankiales bacterium]
MGWNLPSTPADSDYDGIDDALEMALAARYAPVILFHPSEMNYPARVEWFAEKVQMQFVLPDGTTKPVDTSTGQPWPAGTDALSILSGDRTHTGWSTPLGVTTNDPAPDINTPHDGAIFLSDIQGDDRLGQHDNTSPPRPEPETWTTYCHVYPTSDGGVTISYWHFFAYNEVTHLGTSTGSHSSDWDACIHVHLDSSLQPVGVTYSRHSDDHPGTRKPWAGLTETILGTTVTSPITVVRDNAGNKTHPVVLLDAGRHASFWSPADCDAAPYHGDRVDTVDPAALSNGVVWETWPGGHITQKGQIDHQLASSQVEVSSEQLVNLGEYLPGPAMGNAPVGAGVVLPSGSNEWLRYAGYWGELPHPNIGGAGVPGRGPAFQGWTGSSYCAWYVNAASSPASVSSGAMWRTPPTIVVTTVDATHVRATVVSSSTATAYGQPTLTAWGTTPDGHIVPIDAAQPIDLTLLRSLSFVAVDALNNEATKTITSFITPTVVTTPAPPNVDGSATQVLVTVIDSFTQEEVPASVVIGTQAFPCGKPFTYTFHKVRPRIVGVTQGACLGGKASVLTTTTDLAIGTLHIPELSNQCVYFDTTTTVTGHVKCTGSRSIPHVAQFNSRELQRLAQFIIDHSGDPVSTEGWQKVAQAKTVAEVNAAVSDLLARRVPIEIPGQRMRDDAGHPLNLTLPLQPRH